MEKRRNIRRAIPFMRWMVEVSHATTRRKGICMDVSQDGLGVQMDRPIPAGSRVTVRLMEAAQMLGEAEGEIVRVDGSRLGIRLDRVDNALYPHLAD